MSEHDDDEPLGWFDPRGAATLRAAWEDSPALISVVTGPQHVLVYQNAASRAVFGAKELNKPLREVLPGLAASDMEHFDEVRATGRRKHVTQRVAMVPDVAGREVVVSYLLLPLDASIPASGVRVIAENTTAQVQAEQLAARARVLSEVSAAVAGAVDTGGALQAFVDALVPEVADFAAFFVADGPNGLAEDVEPLPPLVMAFGPEVAAVGPPPPPTRRDDPSPWQQTLQAGTPVVIPIDSSTLESVAPDKAAAAWIQATTANSLAVMPMVVAGQITGALLVMTTGQRVAYTEADLPLLTDIAARAGAALAQQQALQRQRDIASRLQRVLLPRDPAPIPGLALAARYVAGDPGVDVGGDWWHVQDLGDGWVALGIGDVSGRGVTAAAVMGQARAAMGAAGHARLAPAEVMRVLDAQLEAMTMPGAVSDLAPPRFATACYGIVDLGKGSIRLSNAGHPPLLRRTAEGKVDLVEVAPGAPLGVLAGGFIEVEVPFTTGDTIALFTDGLVESRRLDLDDGLAALSDALGRFGGHPDLNVVISQVLDAMSVRAGYGDDDMALLLARRQ